MVAGDMTPDVDSAKRREKCRIVAHLRTGAANHVRVALERAPEQLIHVVVNEVNALGGDSQALDGKAPLYGAPGDYGMQSATERLYGDPNARTREPIQKRNVRPTS